jgi:glycosyltransferase involved in cell wall biosynthesis
MAPTVSFVVPCFRLAHLLGDCLGSILGQSFRDLEVLVMDDRSPDNTAEVAASFADPRVRYILNEKNLGHLRNYNAGIELARGRYVWVISADDRLRVPYIVERYVAVLDAEPSVGFAFCPAITWDGTAEGEVWSAHGKDDVVFRNHEFTRKLLQANCVSAPTGLVRRSAYDKTGLFPLDLPFAGDWYLWLALALHFDVAYFAEPMVNYRVHDLNMTKTCMKDLNGIVNEGVAIRWRLQRMIEAQGNAELEAYATTCMAYFYAALLAGTARVHGEPVGLSPQEFEASVAANAGSEAKAAALRALTYAAAGDESYGAGNRPAAREHYARALSARPRAMRTAAKYALLRMGALGDYVRQAAVAGR